MVRYALEAACSRHGVPLAAAALQFPMREPRITATLAGCVRPAEVDRLIEHARRPIPPELWGDIYAQVTRANGLPAS